MGRFSIGLSFVNFISLFCLLSAIVHAFPRETNEYFARNVNNLIKRDLIIPVPPSGWQSIGCYTEASTGRALSSTGFADDTVTIESCIAYCGSKNYFYAGIEYSRECYCGNTLESGSVLATTSDCNMGCSGNSTEQCGGPNRLTMFSQKGSPPSPPAVNPGPPGWVSIGCYSEGTNGRTLTTFMDVNGGGSSMTVALCTAACATENFTYAGIEYGGECYCGSSFFNGGAAVIDGCNMLCNGNSSEYCGGGNRLNVYQAATTLPHWTSLGCYSEGKNGRTLPNGATVPGGAPNMTVELCQTACLGLGYTIAGVEYSQECWCGNSFINGGAPASDGCVAPCKGNNAEICGGNNRLNAYSYYPGIDAKPFKVSLPSGWSDMGCYTDPGPRTLLNQINLPQAMTVESCIAGCYAQNYTIAGVEYGGECWCDTDFRNSGVPTTSGCTMPCAGNTQETCGGPNRLNVYQLNGTPVPATSSSTTSTATSTATNTAIPKISGVPAGWSYGGCYVDDSPLGRILAYQQPDSTDNSIETCIGACTGLGYTVAGMEYSSQCFCDNVVHYGAPLASSDSECGMTCSGNATQQCGGPNRVSLYAKGNFTVNPIPVPQTGGLPGSWKYIGCAQDLIADNVHLLPNQLLLPDINSATACLSNCSYFGYAGGGMEYGQECYCGDPIPSPSLRPESECADVCSGNASSICGGGARLSYYEWQGDSLAQFNYPTGNDAGQYQFLIGGVVVPLMTTVNINGKIMFLEKHGTGPPNSTGAYEFDPYYDGDFDNAWRTLTGLKSDVFCSAGLILPDKAGRQLTIGGWSAESLTGVRLYTPSGSPGSPSTTDWQENVAEVSLQVSRWYPTAMIMANGTILVVGGEIGSNDAPQPTLELLPQAGPVLTMEWLRATDPYNLYPFLVVLPTGGIFTAYYNEARILDEVTFDTVRTLPKIPAGVTSKDGGRTYPLEGTLMILPQVAPYTKPLRVLICGGSTPFTGVAIDNCVSISPENTTDVWEVERMPSKRVISCMTALPDGTYLILNGGTQGVAGFGLGVNPNLNAVLYDPSKPVNHRMSVMANTTIPRMYHSEAVLMPDGRVLVTGSDPQDPKYPEEYRVEVFIPPYLMGNPARPSFNLLHNGTSIAYGESFKIAITCLPSSNAGNIKISILGAESSTHGNTMGQRSIFPAFTCTSSSCTIQAPPNAHVSPPGWFQLFVLDNGIPSHSQFIRIGGDPAGLGNWPNFPDFTAPGV